MDHPGDLETKQKPTPDRKFQEVLTCKYCAIEIDVLTACKNPWDKVNEFC